MLRKNLPLAVLASCFFLIAGCGGGGSAGAPTPTPTPNLTLSRTTVSFGSQPAGAASIGTLLNPITLTDTGSASLTLSSIVLSDTVNYAMTSTCGTSLAVSASCALSFTFKPQTIGSFPATVTITDNAGGSPQTVTLSGTGTPLSISGLSPFTAAVGSSSSETLTLTNAGTAALTFTGTTLGGTNAALFAQSNNTCGTSIAPNASCSVTVTFTPTAVGNFSATLTLIDGSSDSPQVLNLGGTATASGAPAVTFSPGTLTFPATNVGTTSASISEAITNTGTAALTISNIAVTGTGASSYSQTNNCPASLPATTGNCTVFVTFTPTTTGTLPAALSVTDNVTGSPQSVSLTGTGIAPAVTLSASTVTLSSTPNVLSAPQYVTITNSGTAPLSIASIVLGGVNASNFISLGSCGTTLAVGANCNVSAVFTPTAIATYAATITITDNAPNSPQVITLTGTGTASPSVYRTLFVTPAPDNSITPLYNLVDSAKTTLDMTMYEMQDSLFLAHLVARCAAGVKVRVIFSQNIASSSSAAYNKLNTTTNCAAENSNSAFTNTHQKTITVDGATASATTAILSLNLQAQYYSTTRDFAIITNDTADIAAIETTFNMDWAAGTPYLGTQGASDFSFQPPLGDDLVWSPYSTTDMLAIINNATASLYIECEEFSATNVISAIAAAAQRHVNVVFICENESNANTSNFATIKAAGASVWYYSSSTGFYIHAKTVVADLGLPTEAVYMGSINYSSASLTRNRELGVYITGNTTVSNPIAATIAATIVSDETGSGVTKY